MLTSSDGAECSPVLGKNFCDRSIPNLSEILCVLVSLALVPVPAKGYGETEYLMKNREGLESPIV